MDLSDRKLKILSAVVDSYVKNGEPVSSKTLCNILDVPLSSATIRNELAELTELGLLEQPHTSAGRIPSHLGYRLYINKLMERVALSAKTRSFIDSSLNMNIKNPEQVLKEACKLLAKITKFTVVSTNIFSKENYVKNIQLVPISNYHIMIVLTTSSGTVKSQMFRCEFLLNHDRLSTFTKILNDHFVGVLIEDITPAFIQTVVTSLGEISFFMLDVFAALRDIINKVTKTDLYLEGQMNLMLIPEFSRQSVVNVINLFHDGDEMSNLFLSSEIKKTRIFIGEESRYEELSNLSVIITKYCVGKENYGAIGILGPTRMNYANLIANLEYIAKIMGKILNNLLNLE